MTVLDEVADATALAGAIRSGACTAAEVLEETIRRAEAADRDLNLFSERLYERAHRRLAQPLEGPFAGVPYVIKDMFDLAGTVTGYGSRLRQVAPPATTTDEMIDALEAAGFVIIAKTTLGEFGYLPTTESLAHGVTRNPWNRQHSPGGSSGGSAAAVAAGVVFAADAADGGGSIRIPAACCGLFGLKPSRHRMIGRFPSSTPVDLVVHHGITRTVRDSANLLAATERTGPDRRYPPVGRVTGPGTERLRVGVVRSGLSGRLPTDEVAAAVDDTAALLAGLGHSVRSTGWPFDGHRFLADFATVWVVGARAVNDSVAHLLGPDACATYLEPYTQALGDAAEGMTEPDVDRALAGLRAAAAAYEEWFGELDVILSPVVMRTAVPVGFIDGTVEAGTLTERVAAFADVTMVHNAVGAPAMSVPAAMSTEGLPIGVHLAAAIGEERRLLELAFELEASRPWAGWRPPPAG